MIPCRDARRLAQPDPVAVRSHFYEFIDGSGQARLRQVGIRMLREDGCPAQLGQIVFAAVGFQPLQFRSCLV
jgi:hypothetical protein